jgi:hypothetical protein
MKGEPYHQVKLRARHMLTAISDPGDNNTDLVMVLERLIDTAPQQTLSALCDIAEVKGV